MARLSRVELRDFRAFRRATLELEPQGLLLVTGPTNVGKSALLSALDVVAGTSVSDAPYANLVHSQGEQPCVVARFELSDSEKEDLGVPAQWLEWEFGNVSGLEPMQVVAIRISWPGEDSRTVADYQQGTRGEWFATVPNEPLATWGGTRVRRQGSPSPDSGALERVADWPDYLEIPKILADWRASYFHFKPFRQALGRTTTMHSTPTLQSDGSNLAQVLLHLRNNQPDDWSIITNAIEEIVPNVGELSLPSSGNQFEIAFRDRHLRTPHRYNLKDLGSGVEQLLMALVVGATTRTATVVLEEPETGLHPAAQRALLSLLHEWSTGQRVFIAATHSPILLDWGNARVVAVSRQQSESTVEPVTHQRAETLRALGVRLSDVLAAERVLILEGSTDAQLMGVWFPEVIRNPRVAVINAGGGGDARHAQLLGDWIDHADQLGGRKLLYVRDSDELPQRLLTKLKASDRVLVLPCRELENLLLDFDAIAETLNELRAGEPELSATDVKEAAGQVAEDLRQSVVLKRVCWDLEPHRFVDNRRVGKLDARRAGVDELIDDVLSRLPSAEDVATKIREAWKLHTDDVAMRWDAEWMNLVPGADLLDGLWRRFLNGRRYDKASDGLCLAQRVSPPATIVRTMAEFLARDRDTA